MQLVWVDVSVLSFMKKGGQEFDPVRELSLSLYLGLQESQQLCEGYKPEERKNHFLLIHVSSPVCGRMPAHDIHIPRD